MSRAARRYGRVERAREVLERLTLLTLEREIVAVAGGLEPLSLSSMDAIHLSSALVFGAELDIFVAYDARLVEAARAHGLEVASPSE